MKTNLFQSNLSLFIVAGLLCGLVAQPQSASAKAGATDPIPGTSKGGVSTGGGGGGKSSVPAPAPAPAPTPAPSSPVLAAGPITFSAAGPVNGSLPVCTGDFRMAAYYPTLLDMTVNVNVNSMNVPDGTVLYVNVVGANGTLYPYTSNAIVILGGTGSCSEKVFVTLGAGLAGVTITDSFGAIVFAGN